MDTRDATDAAMARFGTEQPAASPILLNCGHTTLSVTPGGLGAITHHGIEVIRALAFPIRDADWATTPATITASTQDETAGMAHVSRSFRAGDFEGHFDLTARQTGDDTLIEGSLTLKARSTTTVNRAGFVLLHPLSGVVGAPVEVVHSNGETETLSFPDHISPGQPVFDITELRQTVHGISVGISLEGEIFEMEDQRNWTDASFKTYCRPLAAPRPFDVKTGETIQQRVVIHLSGTAKPASGATEAPRTGTLPEIALAIDPAIHTPNAETTQTLAALPLSGLQLRVTTDHPVFPDALQTLNAPLTLEAVIPDGQDPDTALKSLADACAAAGIQPAHIIALPEPYLASHQPDGPWPGGTTPTGAHEAAARAFPNAQTGAGMLTNFTELNRCPPGPDGDFVTFGTTAIVHDAADGAVLETLEALPDVFASARALAGNRPIRLGLVSIGMRSNPYGATVAENPDRIRLEMALDDPRQRGLFAAAFAVGAAATATASGITSLSPAMASGPLGALEDTGAVYPLFHVIHALARLTGQQAEITGPPCSGLTTIRTGAPGLCGLATNTGTDAATLDPGTAHTALLCVDSTGAARTPDWLDSAPRETGSITLQPLDVAFLFNGGENA
ncbi:hypothetical protein [Amaricoccus tamworthensis]|uniref:hypothetical protein n=1 Tax=Amaricoccus tamworthensis TaxID=57002 RepID=UPI003C7BDAD6